MQVEALCYLGNKYWGVCRSDLTGELWESQVSVQHATTTSTKNTNNKNNNTKNNNNDDYTKNDNNNNNNNTQTLNVEWDPPPIDLWKCKTTTFNTISCPVEPTGLTTNHIYLAGIDGLVYRLSGSVSSLDPSSKTPSPPPPPSHFDLPHHMPISKIHASAENRLVSGSWDCHIHLYQLDPMQFISDVRAHGDFVLDVKWNTLATNLFATASRDKTLKIWDQRQDKKETTTILFKYPVLCLDWNNSTDYVLALGLGDNSIQVVDTRKPNQQVLSHNSFYAPVNAMEFSRHKKEWLALGSDDTTLSVLNIDTNTKVFEFNGHKDFVRAVSWDLQEEGVLASGSWDQRVLFHSVNC